MTDLDRAFTAIKNKRTNHDLAWQYYDGIQPLVYSTERLKEIFRDLSTRFNQNWCAVVIDSVLDRLTLKGFSIDDTKRQAELDRMWNEQHIELDADDIHTSCQVVGEAFVIVERDGEGIRMYYNDPRLCHAFYKAENPKDMEFCAKWWLDGDTNRMILYYPDRIERYTAGKEPQSSKAFQPDGDNFIEPHDYQKIPVVHFRNERRVIKSAMSDAITIQDAVNKLFADMMVAAEFGAFKQRWAITNADTKSIKSRPGSLLTFPPSDGEGQATQVGEFQETNLGMFLDAIDRLAKSLSIITRTPKSYIMDTGAGVSGDALIAMESPLVKKCKSYKSAYSVTWKELAAFLLTLSGMPTDETEIVPVWDQIESVQPFAQAQTRKMNFDAGIPLVTQLRRDGWQETEIDQMNTDISDAKQRETTMAAAILERLRVQQEQENNAA